MTDHTGFEAREKDLLFQDDIIDTVQDRENANEVRGDAALLLLDVPHLEESSRARYGLRDSGLQRILAEKDRINSAGPQTVTTVSRPATSATSSQTRMVTRSQNSGRIRPDYSDVRNSRSYTQVQKTKGGNNEKKEEALRESLVRNIMKKHKDTDIAVFHNSFDKNFYTSLGPFDPFEGVPVSFDAYEVLRMIYIETYYEVKLLQVDCRNSIPMIQYLILSECGVISPDNHFESLVDKLKNKFQIYDIFQKIIVLICPNYNKERQDMIDVRKYAETCSFRIDNLLGMGEKWIWAPMVILKMIACLICGLDHFLEPFPSSAREIKELKEMYEKVCVKREKFYFPGCQAESVPSNPNDLVELGGQRARIEDLQLMLLNLVTGKKKESKSSGSDQPIGDSDSSFNSDSNTVSDAATDGLAIGDETDEHDLAKSPGKEKASVSERMVESQKSVDFKQKTKDAGETSVKRHEPSDQEKLKKKDKKADITTLSSKEVKKKVAELKETPQKKKLESNLDVLPSCGDDFAEALKLVKEQASMKWKKQKKGDKVKKKDGSSEEFGDISIKQSEGVKEKRNRERGKKQSGHIEIFKEKEKEMEPKSSQPAESSSKSAKNGGNTRLTDKEKQKSPTIGASAGKPTGEEDIFSKMAAFLEKKFADQEKVLNEKFEKQSSALSGFEKRLNSIEKVDDVPDSTNKSRKRRKFSSSRQTKKDIIPPTYHEESSEEEDEHEEDTGEESDEEGEQSTGSPAKSKSAISKNVSKKNKNGKGKSAEKVFSEPSKPKIPGFSKILSDLSKIDGVRPKLRKVVALIGTAASIDKKNEEICKKIEEILGKALLSKKIYDADWALRMTTARGRTVLIEEVTGYVDALKRMEKKREKN